MFLAGLDFVLAGLEVFVGDFGEVVDVIEVGVGDFGGFLADVSGEGEVDEEEGEFGAGFHGLLGDFGGEDDFWGACGADDDVELVDEFGEVFVEDGGGGYFLSEFAGALEGAVGDGEVVGAAGF